MSLNEEEKARIIALGMRSAEPESGFEKHFLWTLDGAAVPCSAKEEQWVEYFEQWYCDLVNSRVGDVLEQTADDSMAHLDAPGDDTRRADQGRRRRPGRKSGRRVAPSRTRAIARQGAPLKPRAPRGGPESRRAK